MGRYATLCVLYTFIYFPQKKFQRDGKDQSIQCAGPQGLPFKPVAHCLNR